MYLPIGSPPLAAQIARLENEIKTAERDREREVSNIEVARQRIANAPIRQQELTALFRDYDSLKRDYDVNLQKKDPVTRAQDLEESKKGEQFQIQDRAHVPGVPYSPNLLQFLLIGLGGGLGLGAAATAVRELLDQAVRSEEEFGAIFPDIPVYGAIPNLDVDTKSRRRSQPPGRAAGPRVAAWLLAILATALPWALADSMP